MNEFALKTISDSVASLLNEARILLERSNLEKIRQLAQRVPNAALESEEEKISVVFAGQYSAGKSSLIRILTGRSDIAVGAKITTYTTASYDWNGITIIDTPGIHTSVHPDHDECSYSAISRADLLIFVITNELMDNYILRHFKKLAIENGKGAEMMLVVNKMEREASGNVEAARNIKKEDLRTHIAPLIPENLYLSFVDAESYNKAGKEKIEKRRRAYLERSNIANFIENLNSFVRNKGLAARYTTSLYTLAQLLEEAISIAFQNNSNEDIDIQSLESILVQNRKLLEDTRQGIIKQGMSKIELARSSIIKEGANIVANSESQNDWHNVDWITTIVKNLKKDLMDIIESNIQNCGTQTEDNLKSTFASLVLKRVMPRLEKMGTSTDMIGQVRMMQSICSNAQMGVRLISGVDMAHSFLFPAAETVSDPSIIDGVTSVTDVVDSGFGVMDTVSMAGPILMTGKGIFEIVSIYLEDLQRREQEERLAQVRSDVRNQFCQIGNSIEEEFRKNLNDYVNKNIDLELTRQSRHLDELRSTQKRKVDGMEALRSLREVVSQKIREIQAGLEAPRTNV